MKRKRTRNFISAVLAALCISSLAVPAQAADDAESGTTLKFDENGEFRILIVADTQDTAKPQEAMLKLLNASLDAAGPDLVVFTGDQVHGPSVRTEKAMEQALDAILSPVTERGIPFAAIYGNHDDEGGVSKETQLAIYRSYPGCLMAAGEEMTGLGNYNLLVSSADGSHPVVNLWFIDSGTYYDGKESKYARVEQDQIDWYTATEAELEETYGAQIPAYLFQHIIFPEIYDMLTEVSAGEKKEDGVVEGFSSRSGHYYKLGDNFVSGHLGEAPCPTDLSSAEFETMCETGDIVAAFFGHDHVNDFAGSYNGMDIVNTSGIGFYIYGDGEYHGTRLIVLHEDAPTEYETEMLYYKDLVSDPLPGGIVATSGKYVQDLIILGVCAAVVLIGGGVFVGVRISRKKKKR